MACIGAGKASVGHPGSDKADAFHLGQSVKTAFRGAHNTIPKKFFWRRLALSAQRK